MRRRIAGASKRECAASKDDRDHLAEVEKRRTGYEAWTDPRLTLDTSAHPPERLLAEAIGYLT